MVSAKPDIFTYQLSDDDYVLFLASDGVWDNLEEEEIFNSIRTFVTDHPIEGIQLADS
jgi:serine/threonine protein phosphatase PrpC